MALTDNLVAYWKLDESSGNASDATGNGYTLTNNGTVTYSSGKINNCAVIDSYAVTATKYLSSGSDMGITGGACSISVWFYLTGSPSSGQYFTVACQGDAGTNVNNFIIYRNSGGTLQLWFTRQRQNVANDDIIYNTTLSTGTWYHLVYTYDGSTVTAYLNGSSVGTPKASTGNGVSGVTDNFCVGALIGNNGAYEYSPNGRMDEVGLWSRALSSTEVSQLYNSGNGLAYPLTVSSGFVPHTMGIV